MMRNQMIAANGEDVENERLLWHGTAPETVSEVSIEATVGKMQLLMAEASTSLSTLRTHPICCTRCRTKKRSTYFSVVS